VWGGGWLKWLGFDVGSLIFFELVTLLVMVAPKKNKKKGPGQNFLITCYGIMVVAADVADPADAAAPCR